MQRSLQNQEKALKLSVLERSKALACVLSFGSRLVVLISNTQAGALNLSN